MARTHLEGSDVIRDDDGGQSALLLFGNGSTGT